MANEEFPEGFFGKEHIPSWIHIDRVKDLHPNALQQSIRAAERWKHKYGFDKKLNFKYMEPISTSTASGYAAIVMEQASGGLITISNQPNAKNIVLHAMTHAFRPEKTTFLKEPLRGSTDEIIGYTGLTITFRSLSNPNQIYHFNLFEEGMAERNAAGFRDYPSVDTIYHALGLTTLRYFPHVPGNTYHKLVSNSDVPGFVKKVLNLPESHQINNADITKALLLYSSVYDRAEKMKTPKEVLAEFGPETWK